MLDPPSPMALDPELGGRLIEAAGTDSFAPLMLDMAQRLADVDELFAYRIADTGPPEVLAWSSALQADRERADQYARRFFRHDPANRLRSGTPAGTGFAGRIAARDIAPHDYRGICFERPRFVEKLCYGWRGPDRSLVVSFYRRRTAHQVDAALGTLAALGLAALARQAKTVANGQDAPLHERLETRLGRAYPTLSPRERQICARTLAGWSAGRIAAALGIGASSVLTYRRRAYARLDISGSEGFLPGLLEQRGSN